MTARQLPLDFQPGLTVQFKTLRQVCAAAVYASRAGLSGVAADLDMAPSDLCRRLADDSERPLTDYHVDGIITSTRDPRPVYWLIEKHLQDPAARREAALNTLATMAPVFAELAEQAGIAVRKRR